eukprot:5803512-Pleurochrysis_carterae.AAC.1
MAPPATRAGSPSPPCARGSSSNAINATKIPPLAAMLSAWHAHSRRKRESTTTRRIPTASSDKEQPAPPKHD